jgi:hypothetical protein
MQGSRNARSRKCAIPRRDRSVRRETGLRQSSNGPASAGGRIPLGPPSPADGMGRRHLPSGRAARTRHLAPTIRGVTGSSPISRAFSMKAARGPVVDRPTISGQFSGRSSVTECGRHRESEHGTRATGAPPVGLSACQRPTCLHPRPGATRRIPDPQQRHSRAVGGGVPAAVNRCD